MTGLTAGHGLLLTLAQHLRHQAAADVTDDGVLLVSTDTRKLEVEVFTDTDPDTPLTIVYRNARTRAEFGSIAHPETAARAVLGELAGESRG